MPTVGVNRDQLFARLGRTYTQKEFEQLCFDYGLELDEVTSEKQQISKQHGKEVEGSEEIIYKIDIPANRYDLLCMEGITRGIGIFTGSHPPVRYTLKEPEVRQTLTIKPSTAQIRPFAVAAVLRNVKFTPENYASFIDLQDKLHQNICRKRTLVAIGTHDLDTVKGPFVYDARAPTDIKFKPLRVPDETKFPFVEYTADKIMEMYQQDMQLKAYLPIIKDSPVYPVIEDSNGVVMSMPPIINGHHSRITLDTKNVFIECTAKDLTKAKIVLNMIVTMFSEYCAEKFTVEPVDVISADGSKASYPDLPYRKEKVSCEMIYKRMGIKREQAAPEKLASLLTRMQLEATLLDDGDTLDVEIPPTRSDVIHACDIWEDAAIAFGFNNIEWTMPKVTTAGKQYPINKLTDQLRNVIAQAGYTEALTFALCKHVDNFDFLRREDDGKTAAIIANPATNEFQECRTNLLSGLLKTVAANFAMALPIQIFEISDVILLNPAAETGASNHRRLSAIICSKTPRFEEIVGLLDYIMRMLEVKKDKEQSLVEGSKAYSLRASMDPAFFSGLGAADIIVGGRRVGVCGVVHPEVLANYNIKYPCGALEMDLKPFL